MFIEILLLTVVGGVIGWITNVLAIKMLFRPINAIKIPILNMTFQGLIPKRRNEISKSIGETVENELVSMTEIIDEIITEENKSEAIRTIKKRIISIVNSKIPILIPASIKKKILEYIEEQIDGDGNAILEQVIQNVSNKAVEKIKIGKMVEEKIDEFELEKIEKIILDIAGRELKMIEWLGGILGTVIGLLQGIFVQFIR